VRQERLLSRRTKAADFHRLKTLEDFDWRFNPNIPRKQIYDLATGHFIRQSVDLLLIGPPGVGIMPGTGLCRAVRELPLNNGPEWFSTRHNPPQAIGCFCDGEFTIRLLNDTIIKLTCKKWRPRQR